MTDRLRSKSCDDFSAIPWNYYCCAYQLF